MMLEDGQVFRQEDGQFDALFHSVIDVAAAVLVFSRQLFIGEDAVDCVRVFVNHFDNTFL